MLYLPQNTQKGNFNKSLKPCFSPFAYSRVLINQDRSSEFLNYYSILTS